MVAAFWRWRWDQIPSKSAVSIGAAVVPAIATAATSFAAIQIATELAQAGLLAAGAIEVEFPNGWRMRMTPAVDTVTLTW